MLEITFHFFFPVNLVTLDQSRSSLLRQNGSWGTVWCINRDQDVKRLYGIYLLVIAFHCFLG